MADNGAQSGFYAARPAIRVHGQLQASLGDVLLQSLMVEETTFGLFRCEANFLNWGPEEQRRRLSLLSTARCWILVRPLPSSSGRPANNNPVFAGRITGIEAVYPPA